MKAAQNLSNCEVPAIPLYQNSEAWLTKSRVKILEYGPTGAYNMISLRLND